MAIPKLEELANTYAAAVHRWGLAHSAWRTEVNDLMANPATAAELQAIVFDVVAMFDRTNDYFNAFQHGASARVRDQGMAIEHNRSALAITCENSDNIRQMRQEVSARIARCDAQLVALGLGSLRSSGEFQECHEAMAAALADLSIHVLGRAALAARANSEPAPTQAS